MTNLLPGAGRFLTIWRLVHAGRPLDIIEPQLTRVTTRQLPFGRHTHLHLKLADITLPSVVQPVELSVRRTICTAWDVVLSILKRDAGVLLPVFVWWREWWRVEFLKPVVQSRNVVQITTLFSFSQQSNVRDNMVDQFIEEILAIAHNAGANNLRSHLGLEFRKMLIC